MRQQFVITLEKSATATAGGGHWVTIKKEDSPLKGRHIFIDGAGNILKGKGIPAHIIHHLNSAAGKHHLEGAEASDPDPIKHAQMLARKSPDMLTWANDMMENHPDTLKAVNAHKKENGKKLADLYEEWGGGKEAAPEPEYAPDSEKGVDDVSIQKPRFGPEDVKVFDKKKTGSTAYMSADTGGEITVGDPDWVKKAATDDPDGLNHVLTHEVGHVISNAHPELEKHIMSNPEGALGRVNNKRGRFEGVSVSPEESWAEAYAAFHTDPEWLKKNHPKTYDFVERTLAKVPHHTQYLEAAKKGLDKYLGKDSGEGKKIKVGDQELHVKDGKVLSGAEGGLHMPFVRIHNKGKAQNFGTKYAQDIEPHGEYMSHDSMNGSHRMQGDERTSFEYGKVHFKNPLFIEHEGTGHGGWKSKLSEQFGGKKGKALSSAIKKKGHDGIVTLDSDRGEINETVNLAGEKSDHDNLEKSLDEGGHWVTVKDEASPLHGRHLFIDGDGKILKGKGIPAHIIAHLNEKGGHGEKPKQPHEMSIRDFRNLPENKGKHPDNLLAQWKNSLVHAHMRHGDAAIPQHVHDAEPWLRPWLDNGYKNPRPKKEKIAGEGHPFSKEQSERNNKFLELGNGAFHLLSQELQVKGFRKILHEQGYDAALDYWQKYASNRHVVRSYLDKMQELAAEHKAKGEGLAPGERVKQDDELEKSFREDHWRPRLKKGNPALVIPRKVAPVETERTDPQELRQGVGQHLDLYHVTPTRNVASIKQSGLIPRYGKPTQGENPAYNAVYFHSDKQRAESFPVEGPATTLHIKLPIQSETVSRLRPDEDTFHHNAMQAISMGDGVAYCGTISPEWIE